MKCVLIHPAWSPEEIFPARTASSQINYWQPLGTLYVGAAMLKAGHEVEFLNGAFMNHEAIMARVADIRPEFVGLYSTTFGFPKAVRTANAIKQIDRDMFVCVGGPYPMAMKAQCLENEGANFDAVVTGEAEQAIVELLERLAGGKSLTGLAGVDFRLGAEIIRNPPRALLEDLDTLPFPARHLLGDKAHYIPPPGQYRRKPVTILITSRGCDRRCIFCFQVDKERQYGSRGDPLSQRRECPAGDRAVPGPGLSGDQVHRRHVCRQLRPGHGDLPGDKAAQARFHLVCLGLCEPG